MKNIQTRRNKNKMIFEAKEKVNLDTEKIVGDKELKSAGVEEGSKVWNAVKASGLFIQKIAKNYAIDKVGDLIDELFLGLFKDSVIDIYKNEKLSWMSDSDARLALAEFSLNPKFKLGQETSRLDSRTDEITSTNIDSNNSKYFAIWFSKNKDENVAKVLTDLVIEIQKQAAETEETLKKLKTTLKSKKIEVTDEEFKTFGPILAKMVDEKKSPEEIQAKLKELKSEVKESCDKYILKFKNTALLTESKFVLTESLKEQIIMESLCKNTEFHDAVIYMMNDTLLTEGWLSKIKDKVKNKLVSAKNKTLNILGNKVLSGMLSAAGLGLSILTGGWAAAGILRIMYTVEKQGKRIRNAFESTYTKFANNKGVFTKMDFSLKDVENSKYSMRFYAKDNVWRVINVNNALKQPDLKWSKAIVEGKDGKNYRERLAEIWDPIFDDDKGGKIEFDELFKQSKGLNIPEKALKMYVDFRENYQKIKSASIESPKIDTRRQSLKKDKLDK